MIRSTLLRSLAASSALLAVSSCAGRAAAQASPLQESIAVGAWTFRPSFELRARGEYRRHPIDIGGAIYTSSAVLHNGLSTPLDQALTTLTPLPVYNQVTVAERLRLGLAVDRGPVTGAVTLQDARVFGTSLTGATPGLGYLANLTAPGDLSAGFVPYEAYADIHTRDHAGASASQPGGRTVSFRLGRQRVKWGDGRLLGDNDWSQTARSLDAARLRLQLGDFDVDAFAAMLAPPGYGTSTGSASPATVGALGGVGAASSALSTGHTSLGIGSQLYGLEATWHALPLLNVALGGLARITRDPYPSWLTPSDTLVADARLFGERRGVSYGVEGVFEGGKIASFGSNRAQRAFAAAGRVAWETALPGRLTFGAEGAYASGDDGTKTGALTRFDPILPDTHTTLSPMGLFAWSNIIEAGGTIGAKPVEWFEVSAAYRYAAFANPNGRWITAALVPVAQAGALTSSWTDLSASSRSLGNEVDASLKFTPWRALSVQSGYGIMIFGDRAVALLRDADRPARLAHWAYLQLVVRAP